MTTTEIIERLQADPVLAQKVLKGMSERERFAFKAFYGVDAEKADLDYIAMVLRLSGTRTSQLIVSAKVWLRHPARINLIKDYLEKQKKQRMWYSKLLNWIVNKN